MTKYTIEKDIPLVRRKGFKYPFGEMEVGESFFHESEYDHKICRRLSNAAAEFNRTNGKQFSVRAVLGGYRVWRIK